MQNYPNVILIVFDTLRKDVLQQYGGNAETPYLNEFVKDAVVYKNAIAPSPWTVPSHASFFTGLYPIEHKIHEDYFNGDKNIIDLISEYYTGWSIIQYLEKSGYNTLGFSANPWLSPQTAFDRDFKFFSFFTADYVTFEDEEFLMEYKKYGENRYEAFKNLIKKGEMGELIKYYKAYRKIMREKFKTGGHPFKKGADSILNTIYHSSFETPFLMFINFMEVHEPVTLWETKVLETTITQYLDLFEKKRIPENRIKEIVNGYKRSLKNLDYYFGKFLQYLKNSKQYDNSLIILISDHGQAIRERNYYGHGNFLYDEIVEVPFIVKYPKDVKIVEQKGYQSLVNIPDLIKNVVETGSSGNFSRDVVFSEVYGFIHNMEKVLKQHDLFKDLNIDNLREKYGYPKKAVFKNNYKLVVNGLNGNIDEFTYGKKNMDPKEKRDVLKDLIDELYIYKGTEKFALPDIR